MTDLAQIAALNAQNLIEKSTEDLKSLLSKGLQITAQYFVILSKIWQELERRGEDLTEFKQGLMVYLPLIATNQLNAELLVRYAGKKTLLSMISKLPMDLQSELERHPFVSIVRVDDQSHRQDVQVSLADLPSSDLTLVFSETGIRTPEEQYKLLVKSQLKSTKKKAGYRRTKKVHVDQKEKMLVVSQSAVSLDAVMEALSQHYQINFSELIEQKNDQAKN